MKKKTLAKLVDEAAVLLQRLVRMEYADEDGYLECFTCGAVKYFKEADGGHFIPRTYSRFKLKEWNIHAQCKGCNGFRAETAKIAYTTRMIDLYGREFVDLVQRKKHTPIKRKRYQVELFISRLKERIKEQEVRLGLRRAA